MLGCYKVSLGVYIGFQGLLWEFYKVSKSSVGGAIRFLKRITRNTLRFEGLLEGFSKVFIGVRVSATRFL